MSSALSFHVPPNMPVRCWRIDGGTTLSVPTILHKIYSLVNFIARHDTEHRHTARNASSSCGWYALRCVNICVCKRVKTSDDSEQLMRCRPFIIAIAFSCAYQRANSLSLSLADTHTDAHNRMQCGSYVSIYRKIRRC